MPFEELLPGSLSAALQFLAKGEMISMFLVAFNPWLLLVLRYVYSEKTSLREHCDEQKKHSNTTHGIVLGAEKRRKGYRTMLESSSSLSIASI